MTATVQPETKSASRRALLAGAIGGLGALAASALGRPAAVRATNGDPITVGGSFGGTNATYLLNSTDGGDAFRASGTGTGIGLYGQSDSLYGVQGFSSAGIGVYGTGSTEGIHGTCNTGYGVHGFATSGYGVFGDTTSGTGVVGSSTSNVGVYGITAASGVAAVIGRSDGNGTAVEGYSGTGPAPAGPAKTGVFGYAVQDSNSRGVSGRTTSGHAIHGTATTGFAGYFAGKVYTSKFVEIAEMAAPGAPSANKARLFVRDNGSGKTQLCVRFPTGAVQVIKTET